MADQITGREKQPKVGHKVNLIAPRLVKPYLKTNKNDRADAEAICEAVSRPNLRLGTVNALRNKIYYPNSNKSIDEL